MNNSKFIHNNLKELENKGRRNIKLKDSQNMCLQVMSSASIMYFHTKSQIMKIKFDQ